MALINKLTAIANAIRGKTGGTNELTLDEMAAAIENLETGGSSGPNPLQILVDEGGSGAAHLFGNQKKLTYAVLSKIVSQLDTSNVTDMSAMFLYCSALTTIPQLDTSNVTNVYNMFADCSNLTTIPQLDTSNVTGMSYMFYRCRALTTIPQLDTSNVKTMYYMFNYCSVLTTIPQLDVRSVTDMGSMFQYCSALTDCYLRNIKVNLTVGSGTSYGHLLTVDSLTHLIYELRDTGSTKTLTVGAANLEKLASVYVKTVEITDEMRAEDDLVDEKLPFVVCESTEEGATLITDYVQLKNWSVK